MLEKAKERQKIEIQTLIQHNLNIQLKKKIKTEEKGSPTKFKMTESKFGGKATHNFKIIN